MKLLNDQAFSLTKADVLRNIDIPFLVEEEFAALVIQMNYAPHRIEDPELCAEEIRTCIRRYFPEEEVPAGNIDPDDFDPLFNFVTRSLDCGERYVGCAHRHAPSLTVKISEGDASPGFDPVPVEKGLWRVMLHVHAVISSQVQCRLRIWGTEEADGEDTVPAL